MRIMMFQHKCHKKKAVLISVNFNVLLHTDVQCTVLPIVEARPKRILV